ncbi:hypothetical protein BBO99_00008666 [Phytophthora kernoviae]|uniref:Uncharacterized protein n=2 Tax=Phytophthora kernoviae TaxID=325452 RepID=A0A421FEF2_9STRA|nr:hypothetical protein G195_010066 [Phytophthora kernoviae 00238/432]RLN38506.1 hypothetical protein BBI17_008654 [Phytophthora kernoviae]RLN74921.1 hypothetical protein BBO99_00008666 [Phytophthora kernoviae]
MQVGAKRQLTDDDLWGLEHANQTATAFAAFSKHYEASQRSLFRTVVRSYGFKLGICGAASALSAGCQLFAPVVLHHVIKAFAAPKTDLRDLSVWLSLFFVSRLVNALIAAYFINSVWILPIQIGVVAYMLYWVIGVAAFAGLGVIGLSTVAGAIIGKVSNDKFREMMQQGDGRMKAVKEVFGAIQVVKLNAWEAKFAKRIADRRKTEMSALRSFLLSCSLEEFVVWASPLLVSIVSMAVYSVVLGQPLTAAKVFTALALFNALRAPLQDLPSVIQACLHFKVSLDRISEYLSQPDHNPANVLQEDPTQGHEVSIAVENGSFGWEPDTPILTNVNLQIKKGDLVVVQGPVGAGKSSLCSALLGEMHKLDGKVFVRGKVAYYSQQPWIQNMTIRDNILFGQEFDDVRYQKVLDACELLPDLAQFRSGDVTEIGEKGVNLSGGQKARVSLARACYSNADVFIFDSPLAAVDSVVQSEIFSKCICELLEDKTVVLVTHSPDVIQSAAGNYSIVMEKGTVQGKRQDLVRRRSTYTRHQPAEKVKAAVKSELQAEDATINGRFVEDEVRREGRVTSEVFWVYFKALGGLKMCALVLGSQLLWQTFQIGSDLWLSHWTAEGQAVDEEETKINMAVYALLGGGGALMVLVRSICTVLVGLGGARHLFNAMTDALLRAPMKFFDTNPIGRIVNRYGMDMGSIDFRMPLIYGGFLADVFLAICQLATAAYMMNFLGILVLPLAWVYVKVANFYLSSSSEITRLQRMKSSPVLSFVGQCEDGAAVIRAFGPDCISRMAHEMWQRIDQSNQIAYIRIVTEIWYIVRIQLIGCGVVVGIVSALVYLRAFLSPGLVGLAFTYALNVDGGLANIVRQWSYVELIMVSPERVMEYTSIEPEGNDKTFTLEPAAEWPQHGVIQFENVVFSYKEGGEPVLKNVSFSIKHNEKIGIVGRTGAGKSSLTMALFRINELVSGQIAIDGADIAMLPLRTLRSRMSIIPQSPVLFKGTLRAYIDPFDEFTDADIWSAFDKVDMKVKISALENQLSFELSENGENFSVGERQMLCMGRALLNKSRIVVMDEATASIDHATEQKLQEMLKRDFQNATVLTIAHRLATVLDSDRILVLSDGEAVEFDTPQNLVKDINGVFYGLAKEGGYLEKL